MTRARGKEVNKLPTAIDLFSGCGGLSYGLKRAGFRVVAAIENAPKPRETYLLNHKDVHMYGSDIRKVSPLTVMKELGLRRGTLDLLAGCPPCQGFSRLRTRNQRVYVKDRRNSLISQFMHFVRYLEPKTIMLENVPALARDKRFMKMCRHLLELGYGVNYAVLDAADYGVPQRRKRLLLLASRVHAPQIRPPLTRRVTVREAIARIDYRSKSDDRLHTLRENRSKVTRELIALVPKNGGSRAELPRRYQLQCHRVRDGFHDVYGRMSWDDVSPTITGGCHNPSKGRFLHPSCNRNITLREAALLQGFPRRYKFEVSHGKEAIALMIGNALPPPFIAIHAKELRVGLQRVPKSHTRPRRH